ncbi:carboxypeptidase-like regulatory domain-containing protein [Hymenobacter lucidus]|uniref:Carboxypeptidase-like regulatory domain-containing protein n=1 Tax=Hymenobacter lucidus TaxID=2880930 RepID=A0ABS8ASP7_9BACT|nr:carboxypeptidase-like regulatory domain-containing protein [Hymenobacter lucidus]MCB2409242.1 carboxypeptidase-like regulatory domain-containing protein [Hymenobacter lucidus]
MRCTFTILAGLGLCLLSGQALAQQPAGTATTAPEPAPPVLECQTLTGVVTDENQQPLTGATVVVQGIQDAFSTNSEGQYIITTKKPIPQAVHLQISAAGYSTQKLVLKACQPPPVALQTLPGTRFKRDGRIKKTTSTGKIKY